MDDDLADHICGLTIDYKKVQIYSKRLWKKIWQTISGYSSTVTDETVYEILSLAEGSLSKGLLHYQLYSKEAYEEWSKSSKLEPEKKRFIQELSAEFNLAPSVAYSLICNYLMFEYYGKIKEFWEITRIGTTTRLKENIFHFYTSERMFLLKTLRHVLEWVSIETYKYQSEYKEYLNLTDFKKLQDNLIEQYEHVSKELSANNFRQHVYFQIWLNRAYREQIELIIILTLTTQHRMFDFEQTNRSIDLFVLKNYENEPLYQRYFSESRELDMEQLMAVEYLFYYILLEPFWHVDLSGYWPLPASVAHNATIRSLTDSGKNTMIVLPWLMIQTKCEQSFDDERRIYRLLKAGGFKRLNDCITDPIFAELSRYKNVMLKSLYTLLDQICFMLADRKLIYNELGVVPTLALFLSCEELCPACLETKGGVDSLMDIAVESFPYDFFSFTKISKALIGQPGEYQKAIRLMTNLPFYLTMIPWEARNDDSYYIYEVSRAHSASDLIMLPNGTEAKPYVYKERKFVQYVVQYSYFTYIEFVIEILLENTFKTNHFDNECLNIIEAGFDVVVEVIKTDYDLDKINFSRLVAKLNEFLYFLDGPAFSPRVIRLYFHVQSALTEFRNVSILEGCPDVIWNNFLPRLRHDFFGSPFGDLLYNSSIFEETVLVGLFKTEETNEDHSMILTFTELLYHSLTKCKATRSFQFSGVIYLFNNVFLPHQTWNYKVEAQKWKIGTTCLNIFHFLLQQNKADLNAFELKVYDLCHYGLLKNLFVVESFLRLFIDEKHHLIYLMQNETNWIHGRVRQYLKSIQTKVGLLLMLMNLKKDIPEEECTLTGPLKYIVKPVTSYFTNPYCLAISELACRFLEKIAHYPSVPLLALLEMDHTQVQSLFLERLRDPIESDSSKMAVLDLINICIATQNGMTAAFFNLKCYVECGERKETIFGDTVCNFMLDFLDNVKKSHDFLQSPLQKAIICILHNVWLHGRENLIEDISRLDSFWPVLFNPFLTDFKQEVEVYTLILRIVSLEMNQNHCTQQPNENLNKTLASFIKDEVQIKKWIQYLKANTENSGVVNTELLHSWSEFLVLARQTIPEDFSPYIKVCLVLVCLDGLNTPLTESNNAEIVLHWAQLYLILNTWKVFENHEYEIITKLTKFFQSIKAFYRVISAEVKEIVLAIITNSISDLKSFFELDLVTLNAFLYPIGEMVDIEHEFVARELWNLPLEKKQDLLKSWMLIIFIGTELLEYRNVYEIRIWFHYRHLLAKVMETLEPLLSERATLPYAKVVLNFLLQYADSPLIVDFLNVDLINFFYRINPPSLTVHLATAVKHGLPNEVKEWWLIFISLIRFNRFLLGSKQEKLLPICLFSFLAQHDRSIQEIVCLTQYTVDITALALVGEALKFMNELIRVTPFWHIEPATYYLVMNGIRVTLNSCILTILGSKRINYFRVESKQLTMITSASDKLQANVINKLIELVYWCSTCLKASRPDLIELRELRQVDPKVPVVIDMDFNVPRFEIGERPSLTYGVVISMVHYLVKAINQLSATAPSAIEKVRTRSMDQLDVKTKKSDLGAILEKLSELEEYTGFMVYLQRSEDIHNDKLASYLHVDPNELFIGNTYAVLSLLDYELVKQTLETLMYFLTCEIYFMTFVITGDALYSYKREIHSELHFFFEFVRKKTSEQYLKLSPKGTSVPQNENELINRYMLANNRNLDGIVENNFYLVLAQWLLKYGNIVI